MAVINFKLQFERVKLLFRVIDSLRQLLKSGFCFFKPADKFKIFPQNAGSYILNFFLGIRQPAKLLKFSGFMVERIF